MSSDPFEVFIAEQGKRETEWSSIRAAKKQKVDDRRTSSKDGQQEELAVNVEELKRRLDEKNTECATLKGQLAELQRASVELLSKNQENVCKVSTRVLAFSTVKVTAPFNNTRTLKFKAETDNYVFCYHQSIVWGLLPASDCCRALFRCLNCAQRFDYQELGSGRKLGGAAEH